MGYDDDYVDYINENDVLTIDATSTIQLDNSSEIVNRIRTTLNSTNYADIIELLTTYNNKKYEQSIYDIQHERETLIEEEGILIKKDIPQNTFDNILIPLDILDKLFEYCDNPKLKTSNYQIFETENQHLKLISVYINNKYNIGIIKILESLRSNNKYKEFKPENKRTLIQYARSNDTVNNDFINLIEKLIEIKELFKTNGINHYYNRDNQQVSDPTFADCIYLQEKCLKMLKPQMQFDLGSLIYDDIGKYL
jgi:hypothetical protein